MESVMRERALGLTRDEVLHINELVPYLDYDAGGGLTLFGTSASEFWDDHHPLMVFLPERAADNYRELHAAFSKRFSVSIHYALKSCYFPDMVAALKKAGARVEIMTGFEADLATRLGFQPHETIVNGVARSAAFRDCLVQAGVAAIGVDGAEELDKVLESAARTGHAPRVMIRTTPLSKASFFPEGSKLGTPLDEAARLLETALKSPHIADVGIHAHQLRQCVDPTEFGLLASRLGDLAHAVSTRSRAVDTLNLGGGFESRFLMERSGVGCADFAAAAADGLKHLDRAFSLILEPGRFLMADAAVTFTGLLGTKVSETTEWAITEVGTNFLPHFPDRGYHPLPLRIDGDEWAAYQLADSICVPNALCRDVTIPRVNDATRLLLLNCGAYTANYAESWACELPDIAVLDGRGLRRIFGPADREGLLANLFDLPG